MKTVTALSLSLFLFILGAAPAGAAPSLVYSTFLPGARDVAVDSAGNAYVLGDRGFPFGHFVAKLSPLGELIFLRQLTLPSMYPSAIAIDPAGYIYVAGTANRSDPTETVGSEANEAFVAKLGPDGTGVIYESFIWEGGSTEGVDLAVDALGQAYLHYHARNRNDVEFYTVVRFSPAGSDDRGVGGRAQFVTAMALGPSGDLFTVGWDLNRDAQVWEFLLERMDASSGALIETLVDDRETLSWFVDVAATPGDGSVVVGTKSERLYVAEFGPAGEEVFSRVLNLGAVEISDVAVTSSGQIVLAVGTFLLWLEGGTGEVLSSMNLGGRVSAVAVGPGGDVYVSSGGYVSRFSENRPPDCSGATASPSVIWPANGKMVPVSILGVTDPEGDAVALKVTGISQDEPGAAFSGIGSSVAQVKAERDGKGDGRVYRILFEATDPSGAACQGEVRVCVPHDRGKGSCVDGAR
ncbi:MAG TPA: SBBP repeat-containing protein [Thermoanaerobaculia bacterium]|nr:SBBP repeat-containing protein [Thermoanaerobaculia bacterium]